MDFFEKYQTQLLYLANNPIGKWYLGIPDKEEIVALTPNAYHLYVGKKQYKSVFRTYPLYEQKLKHLVNLAKVGFFLPLTQGLPVAALTVSSFFSGSGDGFASIDDNVTSWASVRGATSAGAVGHTGTTTSAMSRKTTAPSWGITRAFLPFDTSSLPDGDTVTAAVCKLWADQKRATISDEDWYVHIVETSQASTSEIVANDYDNLTFADLGSIQQESLVTGAYNEFSLNATGLTKISKTGFTKLGAITSFDLTNTEPTADDTDSGYRSLRILTSENSGTTNDPILEVTHGAGGSDDLYGFGLF